MHDDRDLDTILDEALATYMDVEPDPFLRARIVARAAETKPGRTFWIWTFAGGSAAAAALTAALLILHPKIQSPALDAANSASIAAAAPPAASASPRGSIRPLDHKQPARTARRTPHVESAALERSRYKASDDALTEEDRILIEFAAKHPTEAHQVLAPSPQQPVEIKPIVIPPIEIADLSDFARPKTPIPVSRNK